MCSECVDCKEIVYERGTKVGSMVETKNGYKDKFKDDWRYISCDMWRLDKLSKPYEIEDELIERIDNGSAKASPHGRNNLINFIEKVMDEREYAIVYGYVWQGKSMATIGEELGYTRVRIWQVYKLAIEKLREACGDSRERYVEMFIDKDVMLKQSEVDNNIKGERSEPRGEEE
tara:strand:+ start:285 stop:806 length:522 start_codon:yes stop_codon:yes gene_type:complete